MAAKKPCVRCSRSIDQWAKICPFCNTDQEAPQTTTESYESSFSTPPPKKRRSAGDFFRSVPGRIVIGLGIVLLLGGAFAIGMLVYSLGTRGQGSTSQRQVAQGGPAATTETDGAPGGFTLVPGEVAQTSFGQPEAPARQQQEDAEADPLRTDATALSAEVYARMAQAERQRQAEQQKRQAAEMQDPRQVQGTPAWAAGQQAARQPAQQPPAEQPPTPAEAAQAERERQAQQQRQQQERERQERAREEREAEQRSEPSDAQPRTPPVPTSQPLPDVSDLDASGTVRLNLTVDASGRVREVEIVQGVPGITGRLIESVRRWRFRPATENGKPVQGMFPVEVSFNAGQ